MIRTALAVAVLAFAATALVAQSDPIAARKALMKANGDQNRVATEMLEGKRPFNLDEAKKVLATFAETGEKAPALFPDDSKTGGDTAALPAVWENKADFTARLAKLSAEEFIDQVLVRKLRVSWILVGNDFRFGRDPL